MEDTQVAHNLLNNLTNPLDKLQKLIDRLRGENGCPWDRKQTAETMVTYLIEEVYELVEAIENQDDHEICGELGDVLFHVFFLAALYKEKKMFDIKDVANTSVNKMVRRHPHVFGGKKIEDADKVREQWHQIKMRENKNTTAGSAPESVTQQLPALMRAYRISERAAQAGFDWKDITGVLKKTEEEWCEFTDALTQKEDKQVSVEFGDILFTLVNVARFAGIHPERALSQSIRKFNHRFKEMETLISKNNNRALDSISQDELDLIWEKVKKKEAQIAIKK